MVGVVMMRGWAEVRALKLTITSDDNDMIEHDFLKPDVMTFTPESGCELGWCLTDSDHISMNNK